MDSLTQIVLGSAVGEAVLGRKVGNKAMLYGAIAGTIPDLDVIANYFTDTVTAIEVHRGFTHSIVFAILFAPVFGWLISKIEKRSAAVWQDWSWLMFWGLFTHPILDAFTTWGTQLFWPFDIRVAFKNIFVIDPLYTLPFLIFLILAMRAERDSPKRRRLNNLGLIVSSSYLVLSLVLKGITFQKFENALQEQGYEYLQIETKPAALNTILWTANVELKDAYLIGDYSFFDSKPISFKRYDKNHHLLGELEKEDKVQRLIKISNGWYIISKQEDKILFSDLRFGVLDIENEDPDFVFTYWLNDQNEELVVEEVKRKPAEAKELLLGLGQRILGN
ncbi:metal-dependent hydrolase [Antarcticibacterium arcticum]|uniref:Metal-dependent hydrolase n=1 Tax=Antarcticibacterium arcticum TaxID=2585771 RepID=A0A5B8YJS0_9FLAO|nr:metal-dependent hydrolase [Antarcticibacterium arcticum]QED38220.1 metal-dependent hydrolase [Antarcticibacterium arcticum]